MMSRDGRKGCEEEFLPSLQLPEPRYADKN